MVAVLGTNGSGKSTLIRTIVGLLPAARGEVRLFGTPVPRFRAWQRVGYVPQRITAAGGVPATVYEVVSSGLLSRRRLFTPLGAAARSRRSSEALRGRGHGRPAQGRGRRAVRRAAAAGADRAGAGVRSGAADPRRADGRGRPGQPADLRRRDPGAGRPRHHGGDGQPRPRPDGRPDRPLGRTAPRPDRVRRPAARLADPRARPPLTRADDEPGWLS